MREAGGQASLVSDHTCRIVIDVIDYLPKEPEQTRPVPPLTAEERLQAEEFDLLLTLDEVGRALIGGAGARPVHLALAQAHGVDVVAADLQDEAAVHDVQQAAGEDPLLVVDDVLGGGEAELLQVDGAEELLLVDHGAQVAVEEAAALRVADRHHGTHLLPPVQELHL